MRYNLLGCKEHECWYNFTDKPSLEYKAESLVNLQE